MAPLRIGGSSTSVSWLDQDVRAGAWTLQSTSVESGGERAIAIVASGLFGLLIGSFLNVVIYRLPRLESVVQPPSHCPACGTQLGAVENIPVVSWLALRGRCRHCAVPISPRYPIVELSTALLFVALALASPTVAPLAPLDVVAAATLSIGMIRIDGEPVPRVLEWVVLGAAGALIAVSLAAHHPDRLEGAALGGGVGLAAWLLAGVLERVRATTDDFPGPAACVAWGWAAGWTAVAAGVAVGLGLGVLAVAMGSRGMSGRTTTAVAAAMAIAALVAGTAGSR